MNHFLKFKKWRIGCLSKVGLILTNLFFSYSVLAGGPTFSSNNFSGGVWKPTSAVGAPSPRRDMAQGLYNGDFLVFGGRVGNSYGTLHNSLHTYDSDTDSWTNQTVSGLSPRAFATLTPVGSGFMIWGGQTAASTYVNSGTLWNGSSWQPISTVGTPTVRSQHTAVSDGGNRVYIWGGVNSSSGGTLGTANGAFYDVGTGTWTTMNPVGAPPARKEHSAIWSGTEMIVYGGIDTGTLPLGGGGRLRNDNVWVPMGTIGLPDPRRTGHSAIWTGTRMIVWGGLISITPAFTPVNTGGSYNPSTDSWVAISTTNAPAPRGYHEAFWNGTEMIVWGGRLSTGYAIDTWAYNPTTNSWRLVAAGDQLWVPAGRQSFSAVWTGLEMIIFGGFGGSDHATGGRFRLF